MDVATRDELHTVMPGENRVQAVQTYVGMASLVDQGWNMKQHDGFLAERVGVSMMTVRRRLDDLGLLKINPRQPSRPRSGRG